jgi:hypothetical protein
MMCIQSCIQSILADANEVCFFARKTVRALRSYGLQS